MLPPLLVLHRLPFGEIFISFIPSYQNTPPPLLPVFQFNRSLCISGVSWRAVALIWGLHLQCMFCHLGDTNLLRKCSKKVTFADIFWTTLMQIRLVSCWSILIQQATACAARCVWKRCSVKFNGDTRCHQHGNEYDAFVVCESHCCAYACNRLTPPTLNLTAHVQTSC